MKNLNELKSLLEHDFPKMKGPWVEMGSGYEFEFARVVGAGVDKNTHWDVQIAGLKIEVKKGQTGAWFDLTRYCDLLKDVKGWEEIVTLFLLYEKGTQKVKSLIGITMNSLIGALKLTNGAVTAVRLARASLKPEKDSRLNFPLPADRRRAEENRGATTEFRHSSS
jgi:hypothetical protein